MNQTDEEQLAGLKTWWNENARAVILGLLLGSGALFGWRYWEAWQLRQALEASQTYQEAYTEFLNGNQEAVTTGTETLYREYSSTPYPALASLLIAKLAADEDDLETAAEALRRSIENSPEEDLRYLATLRLAHVLTTLQDYPEALALLDQQFPDAYTALVAERKGDVLVAQGKLELARTAYTQALAAPAEGADNTLLQIKLDELTEAPQS